MLETYVQSWAQEFPKMLFQAGRSSSSHHPFFSWWKFLEVMDWKTWSIMLARKIPVLSQIRFCYRGILEVWSVSDFVPDLLQPKWRIMISISAFSQAFLSKVLKRAGNRLHAGIPKSGVHREHQWHSGKSFQSWRRSDTKYVVIFLSAWYVLKIQM